MGDFESIRKAVREILEEDYRFQYDNKSFYPTPEMKSTCQNAVDAVTKRKLTGKGEAEGTGLRKAYDIIAGKAMNHGQLKRMKAFFDKNKDAYQKEKSRGLTTNDSGLIQKWNLWGGDAAYGWVSKNISSHKSKNQKSKDLRPKGHKNMMDPTNTRTRTSYSFVKNSLRESYVDSKGNLMGFDPTREEDADENKFIELVRKWDAGGRYVGRNSYEYWFPMEAADELHGLGISPREYRLDIATEEPWRGQKFIVLVANPKDWN